MIFKRVKYRPFLQNACSGLNDSRWRYPGLILGPVAVMTHVEGTLWVWWRYRPSDGTITWSVWMDSQCKRQRSYETGGHRRFEDRWKRSQLQDPRSRIGAVWPHAEKCQQPPEVLRGQGTGSCSGAGTALPTPWLSPDLWPPEVEEIDFCSYELPRCCCSGRLLVSPGTAARQASLSFTVSWSFLKLRSTESVMPSNHLILCHSLLLLPSIFPSIRVFSSETVLHIRWPKDWSFSFSISPSNEDSELFSFRIDWFELLTVQGTLKSHLHTTVQKHQFFSTQPFLRSNSHIHTWLLKKS